jgi:DNA-binding winged helix-turn-helix (wHTH) protein
MAYRFGSLLYDPLGRRLLRDGVEIKLTHKGRELLLLFLENPGRLLTREDIIERLWAEVAVTDDALRFQVSELRKAFGPEGESFIRTLPREGYRWEAPVAKEALDRIEWGFRERGAGQPAVRHRLVLESREIELSEGDNVLGRDRDAVLWIDHTAVSRRHACIQLARGGGALLEDLGSKNGTFLKGARIAGPVPLADGDEIRIGPVAMTFRVMSRVGTTETEGKGGGGGNASPSD